MKNLKFILIIFITLTSPIKAEINKDLITSLKDGNKLIFIRHAYAPGGGDPENFDINDCNTQRNLSVSGRQQAKNIGDFFRENDIIFKNIYSSEWCRCKETTKIAFKNYKTKSFLNSFFSQRFHKNKAKQIIELNNFLKEQKNNNDNFVFVTHYVLISEVIDYASKSGEVIITDKNLEIIGNINFIY